MRTLRLTLEYDGTRYFGWQRQKGQRSVQEELEAAIRRVTGRPATVHGSGRTDTGVHALGQTASFRTASRIPADRFVHALNAHLPPDVAVRACQDMPEAFHARYNARGKHYRYTVYNAPTRPVMGRDTVLHVRDRLNLAAMRRAARVLVGRHDFRAFAASGSGRVSTVRTIRSLRLSRRGAVLTVDVEGDGFLHKMVRTLVGTLLEAGRGKITPAEVRRFLDPAGTGKAGPTVAGKGLCLVEVHY